MTKNEMVDYLEKRLSVLNKTERDDIINEYLQHIDNKLSEGLSESEAVSTLGNIEDMVRETLSAYNVDPDYNQKEESRIKSFLSDSWARLRAGTRTFMDYILGQKASELLLFLLEAVAVFVVLCVLFVLGMDLVFFISTLLGSIIGLRNLFETLFRILYLVIVIPTFIYIFIMFISLHINKKTGSSDKSLKESISDVKADINERTEEYRQSADERHEQRQQSGRSFFSDVSGFVKKLVRLILKVALICLKLFLIVFIFAPGLFALMGGVVAFAFMLVFAVTGYPCIGLCMMLLGGEIAAASIYVILLKMLFFREKEAVGNA